MKVSSSVVALAAVLLMVVATMTSALKLNVQKTSSAAGRSNVVIKKLNIQPHSLSVSGISSGGFMAVQFQMAYSAAIVGAGVFAGGPFFCSQGQIAYAFDQCMYAALPIDLDTLQQTLQQYASDNAIDPISNIKTHKVFMFSGTSDNTVNPAVMKALFEQYRKLGVSAANINATFTVPAGHAWITNDYGSDCSVTQSPWINNCNFPGGYRVLGAIYGNVTVGKAQDSNLFTYDQSNSFSGTDMDSKGYIYIPTACQQNAQCKIHVSFHGCEQGASYVQEQFVQHTGLNEVAERSNIIVVYPQVSSGQMFSNPNGCWDWFAYSGPDFANKRGSQMAAVANLVKALGSDIIV